MQRRAAQYIDGWQMGQEYDIAQELSKLTMSIIAETLFGASVDVQAERIARVVTILVEMESLEMKAILPTPDWVPTTRNRRENWALTVMQHIFIAHILYLRV